MDHESRSTCSVFTFYPTRSELITFRAIVSQSGSCASGQRDSTAGVVVLGWTTRRVTHTHGRSASGREGADAPRRSVASAHQPAW